MQKNDDFLDKVQLRLLGIAVCAFIVYVYLLDKVKDGLGISYPWIRMAVAITMIILFILSGWQAVRFISRYISKFHDINEKIKELKDK